MKKKPAPTWDCRPGMGKGIAFLRAHVNDVEGDCLIWPMSRNPNGYAQFSLKGTLYWTHRYMCELVNGPPPTSDHEAAHSCGRGKDGCVHPKHLSWKTKSGNMHDAIRHGRKGSKWGTKGQLTPEQVIEIRGLKGQKTQVEIAKMFGIKPPTVRDIYLGRTYRSVSC